MTKKLNKQESRNLAMNIVGAELEKEGYEFLAIKSDLKKNPQFVVIKDKITSFVLVRAVSNSEELYDYRNITTQPILEHSEQFKAKVYYAGVWLGHGSDINKPIINGEEYSYVYSGLTEIL
ncbi:MAG: Na(+)-translocating NADH-quinone reductase subunit F [Flavobacteriaceae bacterium]|jgi:hypothetical protein|nr:Na(+)-translocating NADH-quinone reductase subunit F [Flavobacteriaceae bacterium]